MNIRPVQSGDVHTLQAFIESTKCLFGAPLARTWNVEEQVKESVSAFSYGEGESASNYIFLAYDDQKLVGMLELNTLMGYGINCLSYSRSKALHRSDMLSVCHEQKVITLDQGLLGQHSLAMCYVAPGQGDLAQDLILAAIAYLTSEPEKFSGHVYISLPSDGGELFWCATGLPLIGIPFQNCTHHHAELLPQTPLYECFLGEGLAADDASSSTHKSLENWLITQGFVDSMRISAFDGGAILSLSLNRTS